MQKFLNDPDDFVDEMLRGVLAAHPDRLRALEDVHEIVRADAPLQGKVGIITGGGSGHLPLFLGYVGEGLLDAAAVGDVFASPTVDQILDLTREVDSGAGVLYLYGNYGGDVMNFDLAAELGDEEGLRTATVVGNDDVASGSPEEAEYRRGIAGIVMLFKIAGAAADRGLDLEAVADVTRRAAAGTRTLGVALSPMTLPSVGHPTFQIPDGEMEVGMGIHGEAGIRRGPLATADEVAEQLVEPLIAELEIGAGHRVALLLNGLGSTPLEEQYVVFRRVRQLLDDRKISVHVAWVGNHVTSMEMAGLSLSVMRLDDELGELLTAPATTPFFHQP